MPILAHSELLTWQGAADRVPVRYIAVRVKRVETEGGGWFGIRKSPSLAGALPDARVVEGDAIGADRGPLRVRAPGGELPAGLGSGSRVVLGLVDDDHVICLMTPPDGVADDLLDRWARTQRCG